MLAVHNVAQRRRFRLQHRSLLGNLKALLHGSGLERELNSQSLVDLQNQATLQDSRKAVFRNLYIVCRRSEKRHRVLTAAIRYGAPDLSGRAAGDGHARSGNYCSAAVDDSAVDRAGLDLRGGGAGDAQLQRENQPNKVGYSSV